MHNHFPHTWAPRRGSGLWTKGPPPPPPPDPIVVTNKLYVVDLPWPSNSRGPCPAMISRVHKTIIFPFFTLSHRYIAYCLPQTFACEAMRGILLRGWDLTYMPVYRGFLVSMTWISIDYNKCPREAKKGVCKAKFKKSFLVFCLKKSRSENAWNGVWEGFQMFSECTNSIVPPCIFLFPWKKQHIFNWPFRKSWILVFYWKEM